MAGTGKIYVKKVYPIKDRRDFFKFVVMEANIQNIKIELIQWLTVLDDNSLIQKILDLRKSQTKDWWSEISEKEKASIEKGILEAKNGQLNSHSEARKVYEKWL